MRTGTKSVAAALTLVIVVGHYRVQAGNGYSISPLLLQGDPAPDTPANFETFDRPNIANNGWVAFGGDTDDDPSLDDVIYRVTPAGTALLAARQGEPAPDSNGAFFGTFEFFETGQQINNNEGCIFIVTLSGAATNANRAVYKCGAGVSLIALEGQPAPNMPGRIYNDFGFAAILDDGSVGYLADLDGTAADSVIYVNDTPRYAEGDAVPGMPGITWDGNFDEVQWNAQGDLIFEGNTSMPFAEDMVIWLDTGDTTSVVAQEGQPLMARDGTDAFEGVLQLALASNGTWALRGTLQGAPSTADAIALTAAGIVLQEGAAVPEIPGAVLGNFNGIDINSAGDILVLADLEGAADPDVDEGLFLNGALLITDGVQAPGLPDGIELTDLGFEDVRITDDGTILFAAGYTGGDGLFKAIPDTNCGDCADANCDGQVSVGDINFFVAAVTGGEAAWNALFPGGAAPCDYLCANDANDDGTVTVGDINAFVTAVTGGACP